VNRDNQFLARKFNDCIQLACDAFNLTRRLGCPDRLDDWVDHAS
jgi:hypothetical protein